MSYTGTQLLNLLVKNLSGTFSGDELQSFIDAEGDVILAQARVYEVEAAKPMFSFSAGETSADKSKYASNLIKMASQIRADRVAYPTDISETVSWSGSAEFGTAEVVDFIDESYNKPTW